MNKVKYLNDVLSPFEAEQVIKSISNISLEEYTSSKMIKKHSILERLNMQAVKNALAGTDDFILEFFVTYDKMTGLIQELLVARWWKTHIYPIIKDQICEISSVKTYVCLYHEAIVINLLENFFFHFTACDAAKDDLIEVVEYCYQRLSKMLVDLESGKFKKIHSPDAKIKVELLQLKETEEMQLKIDEMELPIALSCISIIRYVTDHMSRLSFPIQNQILNEKDILLILVPILEAKPWVKREQNGREFVYESHRWTTKEENSARIPKIEAQIWITVYNIFMGQETSKKYEVNDFRKRNLLRLKKFMNEVLFDQIPPLQDLFRAIEELNLTNTNSTLSNNPFIVQLVPQISTQLDKSVKNAREIAHSQLNNHFKNADLKKEYDYLSMAYNLDNVEYFMEDPICASCGVPATKRCTKCKSEWYCSKECQIKRWKQHKEMCLKIAELNEIENKTNKKNIIELSESAHQSAENIGKMSSEGHQEKKLKIQEVTQEIRKEETVNKDEKPINTFEELD